MLGTQIRNRGRDYSLWSVLYRAISWKELGGEVGLADAGIRVRERVLFVAKRAEPNARWVFDPGVGVQNGVALRAEERIVGKDWELGGLHQWSAHNAERYD